MLTENSIDYRKLRIGGVCLILGGILILGNVLFPIPADPLDYAGFLAAMLHSPVRSRAAAIAVPVGVWVLVVGISSIERSLRTTAGDGWGRLGLHVFLVGTTLVTVQYAFANGALTLGLKGASDIGQFLLAAAGQVRSFGMILLWLALLLVGISLLQRGAYPKWAGGAVLAISIAMVVVSALIIVAGATVPTMAISGLLGSLTQLWAIVLGVWVLRKGAKLRTGSHPSRSEKRQVST
jgi:hypothetical protein